MKWILGIVLALSANTALSNGVCSDAVGFEIMADGSFVKGKADIVIDLLGIDVNPQVRAYAAAVKAGKACAPESCANVVVVMRTKLAGEVLNIMNACRPNYKQAENK